MLLLGIIFIIFALGTILTFGVDQNHSRLNAAAFIMASGITFIGLLFILEV